MANNRRRGSLFLLALGVLSVIFLIGFGFTYFAGEQDSASGLVYEQEVAFTLAESAIEEFLARVKPHLNIPKKDNHLFALLRKHISHLQGKDWPIDAKQVNNMVSHTRDTAKKRYDINVDDPKCFRVEPVLTFEPLVLEKKKDMEYGFHNDPIEKLATLKIVAAVSYKGRNQELEFSTRMKIVNVVVPPFSDCTLYIKDGGHDAANFNTYVSQLGVQNRAVVLDNGWDAYSSVNFASKQGINSGGTVESILADGVVPPGRVFIGNSKWETVRMAPAEMEQKMKNIDPTNPPDFLNYVALTNGGKVNEDSSKALKMQVKDAADGLLLKMDYHDDVAKLAKSYNKTASEGEKMGGDTGLLGGLFKSSKLDVKMVGAGTELFTFHWQKPGFGNWLNSYHESYKKQLEKKSSTGSRRAFVRLSPNPGLSGLHLFGTAPLSQSWPPGKGDPDLSMLSPTVVYGPNFGRMFRVVSLYNKKGFGFLKVKGVEMVLPFVGPEAVKGTLWDEAMASAAGVKEFKWGDVFKAFINAGVVGVEHLDPNTGAIKKDKTLGEFDKEMAIVQLAQNFDNMLGGSELSTYNSYKHLMSGPAFEPINTSLLYLLGNLRGEDSVDKVAKSDLAQKLGMFAINDGPGELRHPWENIYKGELYYAMDGFMMDFLLLNKATEDFHRGRVTVGFNGAQSVDRFHKKYVKNREGLKTMELNGILALSDSEPLTLENLVYKGKGVIYNSPNLAFGSAVIIKGDLVKWSTKTGAVQGAKDILTIISPEIIIDTRGSKAPEVRIDAMLISVDKPLTILGNTPVYIHGGLAVPWFNIYTLFKTLSSDAMGEFGLGVLQKTDDGVKATFKGGLRVHYDPRFHVRSDLHTKSTPDWEEFYLAKIVPEKFNWKWRRAAE